MVICRFRYEIPHLYAEYILNTRIYIQDEILIYIQNKTNKYYNHQTPYSMDKKQPSKSILRDNTTLLLNNKRRVSFAPEVTLHKFDFVPSKNGSIDSKRRRTIGEIPLLQESEGEVDGAEAYQTHTEAYQTDIAEGLPEDGIEMLEDSSDFSSEGVEEQNEQFFKGGSVEDHENYELPMQEDEQTMELTGLVVVEREVVEENTREDVVANSNDVEDLQLPETYGDNEEQTMELTGMIPKSNGAFQYLSLDIHDSPVKISELVLQVNDSPVKVNNPINDSPVKVNNHVNDSPIRLSNQINDFPVNLANNFPFSIEKSLETVLNYDGSEDEVEMELTESIKYTQEKEQSFFQSHEYTEMTMEITNVVLEGITESRIERNSRNSLETRIENSLESRNSLEITTTTSNNEFSISTDPKDTDVSSSIVREASISTTGPISANSANSANSVSSSSNMSPPSVPNFPLTQEDIPSFPQIIHEDTEYTMELTQSISKISPKKDTNSPEKVANSLSKVTDSLSATDSTPHEDAELTMDITMGIPSIIKTMSDNENKENRPPREKITDTYGLEDETQPMELTQVHNQITNPGHSENGSQPMELTQEEKREDVVEFEQKIQDNDKDPSEGNTNGQEPVEDIEIEEDIRIQENIRLQEDLEAQNKAISEEKRSNSEEEHSNSEEEHSNSEEEHSNSDPDPTAGSTHQNSPFEEHTNSNLNEDAITPTDPNISTNSIQEVISTLKIPLAEITMEEDLFLYSNYTPVKLNDFMNDIGVKFYDDLDIDINSIRSSITNELKDFQPQDYMKALPKLELLALYQFSCEELHKNIEQGRRVFSEFNETIKFNNPQLFKEYYSSNDKSTLNVKLQLIKDFTRHEAKNIWYDWRTQLTNNLLSELKEREDDMERDRERILEGLQTVQELYDECRITFTILKDNMENLVRYKAELNKLDTKKVKELKDEFMRVKEELVKLRTEIELKKRELTNLDEILAKNDKEHKEKSLQLTKNEQLLYKYRKFEDEEVKMLNLKFKILQNVANLKYINVEDGKMKFLFDEMLTVTISTTVPHEIEYRPLNNTENTLESPNLFKSSLESPNLFKNQSLFTHGMKLLSKCSGSVVERFRHFSTLWMTLKEIDLDIYKISLKYPLEIMEGEDIEVKISYVNIIDDYKLEIWSKLRLELVATYSEDVEVKVSVKRSIKEIEEENIRRDLERDIPRNRFLGEESISRIKIVRVE